MLGRINIFIILLLFLPAVSSALDPYEMALERYRAGEFSEAKAILIKKIPKKAGDYNLLGWISLRTKDPEEAILFFQKSLELSPGLSDSYCGLGYAYYHKNDFKKALEHFNKGIITSDNKDCLEGKKLVERFYTEETSTSEIKNIRFFARGDYFWKKEDEREPELFFVKGVNIGFGMPGRYPTEFPEDESIYKEWFKLISNMGANVIRVYTILPPEFYRALKRHNEEEKEGRRLFLIQGIWAELPDGSDFRNNKYLDDIKKESRDAVDVIHGKAEISHKYGHAHGKYMADISEYVLAFIFGREWEPYEVIAFNSKSNDKEFKGRFLSINNGTAFEVWLTEILDYLITYESERYNSQRPVAFMNWPTLDPLSHLSKASFSEEIELRKRLGEDISSKDFNLSGIFDDDAVSIDENKIIIDPSFKGGLFASYHVYPYFPDFLRNEPAYEDPLHPEAIRYFNYLRELKSHYKDMPLLISEFGLSTSRGIARYHPEGFHHGGLSEEEQAEGLKRLFNAIKDSGAAGGIIFSWIDEWWKTNWMVRAFEENDHLWLNAEDPEEGFGIMAMLPEKAARKDNSYNTWNDSLKLYCIDGKVLKCLSVDSDEVYLYIKLDIKEKLNNNLVFLIAIDTYGDDEGDHHLPFNTRLRSPVGFEFVILIRGTEANILVDDYYAKNVFDESLLRYPGMSGYRQNPNFRLASNNNGRFVEIINIHRRRFSRDGKVFPERIYNASPLKWNRDFYFNENEKYIEIRIPWGLLGFSDPSQRKVVFSKDEHKRTEGIRFLVLSYRPVSESNLDAKEIIEILPSSFEEMKFYKWKEWTSPSYVMRPKSSYYVMGEVFRDSKAPDIKLYLPEKKFKFDSVIMAHYNSIEDFLRLYDLDKDNGDIFGQGLSYLIKGLITNNPFYILESKRAFLFVNKTSEGREAEGAGYGLRYIDNLFHGHYEKSSDEIRPERIVIEKIKPEKKDFKRLIIGKSFIKIENGFRIKTQVDRVTRDWLSGFNHSRSPSSFSSDFIVPWHEGKKVLEILDSIEASVKPVWGTVVKRIGDIWYAPDEKGLYRFPISEDKIYNYPGNFILDRDTVIINDTHGINSIAWDSEDAGLIIGCGDHEGKVEAAYYLAQKGINIYMPTDRFLHLLIGTKTEGRIIGSAPVKKTDKGLIIGGQPVEIEIDEPIVVSNSEKGYPVQYYDTPYRYFKELERYLQRPLKLIIVNIIEEGQAGLVVQKAEETGAKVIGIRVRTGEEYEKVSVWLKKDKSHRAILFHSAVYEEGYRLFFEFPEQTSFGDINIDFD